MDYRALAEFITTSILAFSVLVIAMGFTVRVFVAPVLREFLGNRRRSAEADRLLPAQLARLEERLDSIEHSLDEIQDQRTFDRALREISEKS
jgi:Na+-translocating ferredoxin:NAD+ oxidoreductase RnfE subunit